MRSIFLTLLLILAGCSRQIHNADTGIPPSGRLSTPVRWKVSSDCMAARPLGAIWTREELAHQCKSPGERDFSAIALSGGGVKAAVFSGEAMFYLQALGLLQHVSVISSVSGGSFAGAMYALSCDMGDDACFAHTPPGLIRIPWRHDVVVPILGTGYGGLVSEQLRRLLVPFAPMTISSDRFAEMIDRDYLNTPKNGKARFTFADLNPRRPHLFLNSTIVSENRGGLGAPPNGSCADGRPRGYLRRRTPDELFHFAFSDFYFNALRSDLSIYPVAGAVAASAAFPALIDNTVLEDFCTSSPGKHYLRLMDGGANDNQGLIEIYAVLAELAFRQARSDLAIRNPGALETLTPRDHAWLFAINSSVTDSTGRPGTRDNERARTLPELLVSLYSKVTSATDTYSAIGYVLRKQLYLAERERLARRRDQPEIHPVEITLAQLDHYRAGGSEAVLRERSGIGHEASDIAEDRIAQRRIRQRRAYDTLVRNASAREKLRLSNWHPQCYFTMRAELDQLIDLTPDQQACLREAARWSVALRAQELCDAAKGGASLPKGLLCSGGIVSLSQNSVLNDITPLPGVCRPVMTSEPESGDKEAVCQQLAH